MKRVGLLKVLGLVLVAAVVMTSAALAGEAKTHDGLFVRVALGGGTASAKISPPGGSLEFSGTAGDVDLAIGKSLNPNFALHASLWGWSASKPDAELVITGLGSDKQGVDGTVTMGAVGLGGTYFFMPLNAYVTGSVGLARLKVEDNQSGADGNSDSGFGFQVAVGKEWWVGQNFGLGVAGDMSYFSAKDNAELLGTTDSWGGPAFGLRLSATFN